jgi:hypothetical protein
MRTMYFHGSYDAIEIGTQLKKPDNAFVDNENVSDLEDLFESERPENCISRADSLFLCAKPEDIDCAGGYTEHIYIVRAEGEVQKSDLAWYTEAEIELCNGNRNEAKVCAENYWTGKPFKKPENSLFEYRCKSAVIENELLDNISNFHDHNVNFT